MSPAGSQPSQDPAGSQPSQDPAGSQPSQDPAGSPLLSVVKGEPTPEELAALAAVVLSLGQGEPAAPPKPGVRHWVRRQQLRLAPKPGPDAWRRSPG